MSDSSNAGSRRKVVRIILEYRFILIIILQYLLDFYKIFDRIYPSVLVKVLFEFGFGDARISLILVILSSLSWAPICKNVWGANVH